MAIIKQRTISFSTGDESLAISEALEDETVQITAHSNDGQDLYASFYQFNLNINEIIELRDWLNKELDTLNNIPK